MYFSICYVKKKKSLDKLFIHSWLLVTMVISTVQNTYYNLTIIITHQPAHVRRSNNPLRQYLLTTPTKHF